MRQRIAVDLAPFLERNGGVLLPCDTPDRLRGCLKAIGMELEFADSGPKPRSPKEHTLTKIPSVFAPNSIANIIRFLHKCYRELLTDLDVPALPPAEEMSVREGLYWVLLLSRRLDNTSQSAGEVRDDGQHTVPPVRKPEESPARVRWDMLSEPQQEILRTIHDSIKPLKTIEAIAKATPTRYEPDSNFRQHIAAMKRMHVVDKERGKYVALIPPEMS